MSPWTYTIATSEEPRQREPRAEGTFVVDRNRNTWRLRDGVWWYHGSRMATWQPWGGLTWPLLQRYRPFTVYSAKRSAATGEQGGSG